MIIFDESHKASWIQAALKGDLRCCLRCLLCCPAARGHTACACNLSVHLRPLQQRGYSTTIPLAPRFSLLFQAKNLLGGGGAGEASLTALAVEALQRALPNARVIYSSATGGCWDVGGNRLVRGVGFHSPCSTPNRLPLAWVCEPGSLHCHCPWAPAQGQCNASLL